jgi:putative transcriptional regulator
MTLAIRHHPRDETLLAYSAGTLVSAISALVACHLTICPRCRAEVHRMEMIGGVLLGRAREAGLSATSIERAVSRLPKVEAETETSAPQALMAAPEDSVLPRPLARHLGKTVAEIPWKELAPGVEQFKIKMLRRGGDLRLLRVQAGRKLLRHGHYGSELTMVLKGAYGDETGEYQVGEVADLDEEVEHRPRVTAEGECICIIAGETYPRYKTLSLRLLRPFLGI